MFDRYDIVNERDLASAVTKLAIARDTLDSTKPKVLKFPTKGAKGNKQQLKVRAMRQSEDNGLQRKP